MLTSSRIFTHLATRIMQLELLLYPPLSYFDHTVSACMVFINTFYKYIINVLVRRI
jgi:hypothetical protein